MVSFEQLVIDHEICTYLDRIARGMGVNQETLAVDLVWRVARGGQFLKEPHTLRHFRSEHWIPDISCRAAFGRWMKKGGKDIVQRAKERAQTILNEHRPKELRAETREALARTVKAFDARS